MSAELSKRDAAVRIVATLREAGHVAYLAGGCVRDALLGVEPKDYDVATSARPNEVRKLLPRSRFVGEAFGVVLVNIAGHAIEVATFRVEWGYEDGRRPSHVEFTDARGDAVRRDFTINGLFEDPLASDLKQRVIDYVGGVRDIERKVVRAIGNPDERFAEDYLRMLRAVRFAARLEFKLDRRTALAVHRHAGKLERISRERIGMEVTAMLSAPASSRQRARAARLMQKLELDAATLSEPHQDVPLRTLRRMPDDADYPAALAAWMFDRHLVDRTAAGLIALVRKDRPAIVSRWRKALTLSNDQTQALTGSLVLLPRLLEWRTSPMAQRKRMLADARYPAAIALLRALSGRAGVAELTLIARRIARDARPLLAQGVAPTPMVTGNDLIAMGLEPGPDFATWLRKVYDAQLEGEVKSRDEALAWLRENTR